MKRTAVIGLLLLGPVSTSAALTDDDDKLKEALLNDLPLLALTFPCGIIESGRNPPYTSAVNRSQCNLRLKIIATDFEGRGYVGRYYCPPAEVTHRSAFFVEYILRQAITDYVMLDRPESTERAVDVALRAFIRAYPCKP